MITYDSGYHILESKAAVQTVRIIIFNIQLFYMYIFQLMSLRRKNSAEEML